MVKRMPPSPLMPRRPPSRHYPYSEICLSCGSKLLPPLVFIHGSYHGAWCWAEHWMPFLAAKGYETYSISLRGTSGTLIPGTEVSWVGCTITAALLPCSFFGRFWVTHCAVRVWNFISRVKVSSVVFQSAVGVSIL